MSKKIKSSLEIKDMDGKKIENKSKERSVKQFVERAKKLSRKRETCEKRIIKKLRANLLTTRL